MQPIIVISLLWVLWFLTWLAAAIGSRAARYLPLSQDIPYRLFVMIGTLMLFGVTPWTALDVQHWLWPMQKGVVGWLLVALAVLGFSVAWWGQISRLIARGEGPVIERGAYKVMRHPVYFGVILATFGTAAMFGKPSSMIGAGLLTLSLVLKILLEEHRMRSESGAYDDYTDRVPMLVPFASRRMWVARHAEAASPPVYREPVVRFAPEPVLPQPMVATAGPVAVQTKEDDSELFEPEPADALTDAPVVSLPSEPVVTAEPPTVVVKPAQPVVATVQDEKLGRELGLTPAPAKPVQLSLTLDVPEADKPDSKPASNA